MYDSDEEEIIIKMYIRGRNEEYREQNVFLIWVWNEDNGDGDKDDATSRIYPRDVMNTNWLSSIVQSEASRIN